MAHFEETLDTEFIFSGKVFSGTKSKVGLEDGTTSFREILCHPGGAAILPLTRQGEVYLVKQFRYALGREVIEIPGGKLESGEDPETAAKRELLEECGLRANVVRSLMPIYPTVGYDTECIHMFLAQELTEGTACPDPGEFVTVMKRPLEQAVDMVLRGEIQDGKTVAALLKTKILLLRGELTIS